MAHIKRRKFTVKNDFQVSSSSSKSSKSGSPTRRESESDQSRKTIINNINMMQNKLHSGSFSREINNQISYSDTDYCTSSHVYFRKLCKTNNETVSAAVNTDFYYETQNVCVSSPNDKNLTNENFNNEHQIITPFAVEFCQNHVQESIPQQTTALCTPILASKCHVATNSSETVFKKCVQNMKTAGTQENIKQHIDAQESGNSLEDMCRICHGSDSLSLELGPLVSACLCRGTVGLVHVKCLEQWLTESGKIRCELCGSKFATRRVHRYGVMKALIMWMLSQNAKQLMVDSLGILLMSPLAVLAAWLSGRTLSGLMTQDPVMVTAWPLASTFVLSCMTLVCYYCWIVSAATRHAIGWWLWYRSQYEIKLEFPSEEQLGNP